MQPPSTTDQGIINFFMINVYELWLKLKLQYCISKRVSDSSLSRVVSIGNQS